MRYFLLLIIHAVTFAAVDVRTAEAAGALERRPVLDRLRERREERNASAVVAPDSGEKIMLGGVETVLWLPTDTRALASLVVFSHGFKGCATQSTFLTKALAKNGYIVAAPNHQDASCVKGGERVLQSQASFASPEKWSAATYADRRADIVAMLNALKAHPLGQRIDWGNIALAGHSLGGYTVLGMAGGWPEWKLPDISAVLALSPYCTPFSTAHSLMGISAPVMYQGGTLDKGITPFIKKKDGCFEQTPSPAMFVEFPRMGHLGWADVAPQDKQPVIDYALAFLNHYLRDAPWPPYVDSHDGLSDFRRK